MLVLYDRRLQGCPYRITTYHSRCLVPSSLAVCSELLRFLTLLERCSKGPGESAQNNLIRYNKHHHFLHPLSPLFLLLLHFKKALWSNTREQRLSYAISPCSQANTDVSFADMQTGDMGAPAPVSSWIFARYGFRVVYTRIFSYGVGQSFAKKKLLCWM